MPADRALQMGILNHLVPPDRLEAATEQLATFIARNSPLVISLLKEQLRVLAEAQALNVFGRFLSGGQLSSTDVEYSSGQLR